MKRKDPPSEDTSESRAAKRPRTTKSEKKDQNQDPEVKRYAISSQWEYRSQSKLHQALRGFLLDHADIDPVTTRLYLCSRGVFTVSLNSAQLKQVTSASFYSRHHEIASHINNVTAEWWKSDEIKDKESDPDYVEDADEFTSSFAVSWEEASLLRNAQEQEVERVIKLLETKYQIPRSAVEVLSPYLPLVIRVKEFVSETDTQSLLDLCIKDNVFENRSFASGLINTDVPLHLYRKSKSLGCTHRTLDPKMFELMRAPTAEGQTVIRYLKGDFLRPHFDVSVTDAQLFRSWTALVYLNNLPSTAGGKTTFTRTRPQLHIEPRRGDLLMFLNGATTKVDDDDATTTRRVFDWETRHCGGDVLEDGTPKWIYQYFGEISV